MRTFSVKVSGVDSLQKSFQRFPKEATVEARAVLDEDMARFKSIMQKRSSVGPLFKKSGRLKRSWAAEVAGSSLSNIRGSVHSFSSLAKLHEEGGDLTAKLSSAFTIPTIFNQRKINAAGSITPRISAKKLSPKTGGAGRFVKPRDVPRAVLAQLPYVSSSMLAEDQAGWLEGGELAPIPMFTLVRRVHYPARLKMFETSQVDVLPGLHKRLADRVIEPLR